MNTFRPRLMDATTASERMDALCEFIEFWLGPQQPSYGESREELAKHQLPMPLRRLYEFAGRWPNAKETEPRSVVVPALACQDYLYALSALRKNGEKFYFLGENQGVWGCRTLSEGEDPPVWCNVDGDERLVSNSLSRFLVTFVLQELTFSSKLCLCDLTLRDRFVAERTPSHSLWTDEPYVHEGNIDYFLWRNVLVRNPGSDHCDLATNNQEGIDFLNVNQGAICQITLMFGSWALEVRSNGSAHLRFLSREMHENIETPPAVFEFEALLRKLMDAGTDRGEFKSNPMVFCRRAGQTGGTGGKHIHDKQLVAALYHRTLEHASVPNNDLKRRLAEDLGQIQLDPRWLTSTVVDLATAIKETHAFDRLPVLADALMDAGCDSDEIITHCRGEGPHCRSCWVVDLLLGEE